MTTTEFLKIPLSKAILMVVKDMEVMMSKGITINMSTWLTVTERFPLPNDTYLVCAVCMGGAAIMPFISQDNKIKATYSIGTYDMVTPANIICDRDTKNDILRIAKVFDAIRTGDISRAVGNWYGVLSNKLIDSVEESISKHRGAFYGTMNNWYWEDFKQYATSVSEKLTKIGY